MGGLVHVEFVRATVGGDRDAAGPRRNNRVFSWEMVCSTVLNIIGERVDIDVDPGHNEFEVYSVRAGDRIGHWEVDILREYALGMT